MKERSKTPNPMMPPIAQVTENNESSCHVRFIRELRHHTLHDANVPIKHTVQKRLAKDSRSELVFPGSEPNTPEDEPKRTLETMVPRRPHRSTGVRPTLSEWRLLWSTVAVSAAKATAGPKTLVLPLSRDKCGTSAGQHTSCVLLTTRLGLLWMGRMLEVFVISSQFIVIYSSHVRAVQTRMVSFVSWLSSRYRWHFVPGRVLIRVTVSSLLGVRAKNFLLYSSGNCS
jgi:hypothetical protein